MFKKWKDKRAANRAANRLEREAAEKAKEAAAVLADKARLKEAHGELEGSGFRKLLGMTYGYIAHRDPTKKAVLYWYVAGPGDSNQVYKITLNCEDVIFLDRV